MNKKSALIPQAVSFLPFFNFLFFDLSAFSFALGPTSVWVSLSYAAQQKAQEELGEEQQKQQRPGAQDLSSHTPPSSLCFGAGKEDYFPPLKSLWKSSFVGLQLRLL